MSKKRLPNWLLLLVCFLVLLGGAVSLGAFVATSVSSSINNTVRHREANVQLLQDRWRELSPEAQGRIKQEWVEVRGDPSAEHSFITEFVRDSSWVTESTGYQLTHEDVREFFYWIMRD